MKRIGQYSGGAGSWAAAKRVVERHGTDGLTLLFADTLIEDTDLYRFLLEGAANVYGIEPPRDLIDTVRRMPEAHEDLPARRAVLASVMPLAQEAIPGLVWIAEGRTPFEVFRDVRLLGNSRFDPCSKHLKRDLIDAYKAAHFDRLEDVCYVGIDWSEKHRYDALASRWQAIGWRYEAPLCERPWLTPQEQEMRDYLGKNVSMATDRKGGNGKKPLPLSELRARAATDQVDFLDIGGCACGLPEVVA